MEAVACRGGGGVLAPPLPRHRAGRRQRHGVCPARRRFLVVASLREAPSRKAVAVCSPYPARELHRRASHWLCSNTATAPLQISGPSHGFTKSVDLVQVDDEYVASTAILSPPNVVNLCPPDPVNTVRVKFVLQKRCEFGQRFLVVGDDPALGLWDPTNAIALDWSEGHVWTAKMDLAANKSVQFKFLLQDPCGHVRWQHGCNRTLHIAEASSTVLVVHEDWDDAGCQEVSEDVDPSARAEDTNCVGCDGTVLVDGDRTEEDPQTDKGLTEVVLGTDSSLREVKNIGADEAKRPQFTLEKTHEVPDVLRRRANMAAAAADYAGRNGGPMENWPASMFENDMVWLRKTLQRLLQSLGLRTGTTS